MLIQERHLSRQPLWQAYVIRIHPRDVFASCKPQTLVQRSGHSDIDLVSHQHDPWLPGGIALQDSPGVISGTIVNDNELEIGKGLIQDALDGFTQVALTVVHRHQH